MWAVALQEVEQLAFWRLSLRPLPITRFLTRIFVVLSLSLVVASAAISAVRIGEEVPSRIGNTNGLLRVDILAACVDWTC